MKITTLKNQQKNIKANPRKGFTLMELLVAIGIFTLLLGIITTSYISIVRGHGETNERRKMLSDIRFVTDLISNEIREGAIDYNEYCQLTTNFQDANNQSPDKAIYGNQIEQKLTNEFIRNNRNCSGTNLQNGKINKLIIVSKDGTTRTTFDYNKNKKEISFKKESLTGDNLKTATILDEFRGTTQTIKLENTQIDNLAFYITPLDNPYENRTFADDLLQFQPKVTLFLEAGIPSEDISQPARTPIDIQTTISSRTYSAQN